MTRYAIRGGAEGMRRLDLVARTMEPTTRALLADVNVPTGGSCVDLGSGGGHVSRHLAELVGSSGSVLALDFDEVKLRAAKAESDQRNIEFRVADVAEWTDAPVWDLAYGRFILSHLPDRKRVVQRWTAALHPGGALVLEDIDYSGAFCFPHNNAFERYCVWYCGIVARRLGDAFLGPKLPGLFLKAGIREPQLRVVQPVHTGHAPEKALSLLTLVNIGDALLAEGMATMAELNETVAELEAFTADPNSIIATPRIFQVWGRRSQAQEG
jgi:SAM-dependent methyltransferase